MKMLIYKIRNKFNGKCYVGQTVRSLHVRRYWHIYSAKTGPTSLIHRAIRKYGTAAFEWSVIDTAECQDILNEKEIYWISYLNTKVPNGYNITDGGTGGATRVGREHSAKTIGIMSEQKMGKNNPFFGKSHSEETIKRLSLANLGNRNALGNRHTEEFKRKQAERFRGDKNPMKNPEIARKMILSKKANAKRPEMES